MARLSGVEYTVFETREAVARIERELSEGSVQGKRDLSAMQAHADADRDIPHTTIED